MFATSADVARYIASDPSITYVLPALVHISRVATAGVPSLGRVWNSSAFLSAGGNGGVAERGGPEHGHRVSDKRSLSVQDRGSDE